MSEQQKKMPLQMILIVAALILVLVIIGKKFLSKPAPQIHTEPDHQHQNEHEHELETADDVNKPKKTLDDVIKTARGWGPAFNTWYGQMAPDFTLTDITGKIHKLSDYRGKDVMIVFWATWCGPCIIEIPHLIKLRNIVPEDKLAMLAISFEDPGLVKRFAERRKMNYTILAAEVRNLPKPYSRIYGIPSSFFINPDGKIKFATEGLLTLSAIQDIFSAQ